MFRISTEIGSISTFNNTGDIRAIEIIAESGFDCFDYSMDRVYSYDFAKKEFRPFTHPLTKKGWRKHLKNIKKAAKLNDIVCNQMHAPFPITLKKHRKMIRRTFQVARVLKPDCIVFHPENLYESYANVKYYKKLCRIGRLLGVKIATENMWDWDGKLNQCFPAACASPEEMRGLIDKVNSKWFGACVDVGHAEMRGSGTSAVKLLEGVGDKVIALHLHDNDKWKDLHAIPFSMDIDFDAISKALKNINYKYDITLEAVSHLRDKNMNLKEEVQKLALSARRIASLVENS